MRNGLENIFSHLIFKTVATKALVLIMLLGWSGSLTAQRPPDTTYGQGNLRFLHGNNPVENVEIEATAIAMSDSIIPTVYTGVSDVYGEIPFDWPTGIDYHIGMREFDKSQVSAHPIPGNELNIVLPQTDNYDIRVFDLQGRLLQEEEFNGTNHVYTSLSDLPTAPYIVHVSTDNQVVHTQKTIKVHGSVNGPHLSPQAATTLVGKTALSGASYRVKYDAPQGYVDDSTDVTLQDGQNGLIDIQLTPWDTLRTNQGIISAFDAPIFPNKAGNIPLTLKTTNMGNVIDTSQETTVSNSAGFATYQPRPVYIDTLGQAPSSATADVKISWPEVINPNLDSNSVNVAFESWYAGDTTVPLSNGSNPNINILLNRKPVAPQIGHEYIALDINSLDSMLTATPASGAIATLYHNNQTDTITLNAQGEGLSAQKYPHGDTVLVSVGYPGGVHPVTGDSLLSYHNIPIIIAGTTYNRLVQGDTTATEIKAELYPNFIYTNFNDLANYVTAGQIDEQFERTNVHTSVFDTLAYHISSNFSVTGVGNIREVMDSASAWGPVQFVEVPNTIPNAMPYNPQSANALDYGVNFIPGNNSVVYQAGYSLSSPYGIGPAHRVGVLADVNTAFNGTHKEGVHRALGSGDVSSRISNGNGFATQITEIDYSIYEALHHFGKSVHVTNNQNVSVNYLSDNNNIIN